MIRKLLPILLALLGAGGGVGIGFVLRPVPEITEEGAKAEEHTEEVDPASQPEYVKMNNQFVVPVVEDGKVAAMVILSLSLEVKHGTSEAAFSKEPKLRDMFLRVLFDHANAGGFRGSFTDGANLVLLRGALKEAAQSVLDQDVTDVLINEIMRQDT